MMRLLRTIDKLEAEKTELEGQIGELELLWEENPQELMDAQVKYAEVDEKLERLTDILMSI
jgi:chromosome segregation ATPase